MWKLAIEDDQANKTVVSLVRDEYTVGRAEDNTVRLTERNVSRRHARVRQQSDLWLLQDLDSYNGCFVNGRRVLDSQALEHGDLVQIGDYRLTVVNDAIRDTDDDLTATVPAGPRSETLLDQPDRLVMLVGPTPGVEFPLIPKALVIGRGDECDITLNHSSVSRVHAEVRPLEDGRYEIVDRNSANGVRVNGVDLPKSLLDARDTMELGDVVLKFIPAGQIYRPSPEESQQISALASASPTAKSNSNRGRGLRLLFLGVLIGLGVAALAAYGLRRTELFSSEHSSRDKKANDTADALAQARELFVAGDVLGAHAKVQTIPESSNARQSELFKEIEANWADTMLSAAENETIISRKRELLDAIARAASVDAVRRANASDAIAKLDADALDITELPTRRDRQQAPPAVDAMAPTASSDAAMALPVSKPTVRSYPVPTSTAKTTSTPSKPTPLRVNRPRATTRDAGTQR